MPHGLLRAIRVCMRLWPCDGVAFNPSQAVVLLHPGCAAISAVEVYPFRRREPWQA